jgi:hypothetical protein
VHRPGNDPKVQGGRIDMSTLAANGEATVETSRGRHHEEDFARLTASQERVRMRITMRRLVRALLPGADLNSHEAPE